MTAPNTETTSLKQQLGHGSTDGVTIAGSATQKIGFFGTTPVVQQSIGTTLTTTGMHTDTTALFTTTTKNQAFIQAVIDIQTALKNLGLSA